MTNKSDIDLRNIVLTLLVDVEKGQKSHLILKKTLDEYSNIDKNKRSFVTRLFQGTIERRLELDYIINQFSKIKVNKMKPIIRNVLRMTVYQLKYMEFVPNSAACNEAVNLTEKRGFGNLKSFVNGISRNIARNMDNIQYPKDYKENISVKYSIPLWIVEMWFKHYGKKKTIAFLDNLYSESETTVRCNTSKASKEEIINNLEYNKVKVEESEIYNNCLFISEYNRLSDLQVFKSGMITVQNLSSMLASIVANPKINDYIIDVCAAPGGKSLHMSELMKDTGKIISRDINEYKINLIKENVNRIGCKNIKCEVHNALDLDENSIEKADIVMADLPCSGLGVIGNKSDIKYNISLEQIKELVNLQRNILKIVSRYVKPGGKLIFSTCTVNHFENQENVKWIEENLPFKQISLKDVLPEKLRVDRGYIQIFPGEYKMDGFFISVFKKQ